MSKESHWTFSRGRGGSIRSDGISFNPALKWGGDIDDPPIRVVGEGEEWCWEVRFPGETGCRRVKPSEEGLYTPLDVQAWIDRKYPLKEDNPFTDTYEVTYTEYGDGMIGGLDGQMWLFNLNDYKVTSEGDK
jgi:hypothetical protein